MAVKEIKKEEPVPSGAEDTEWDEARLTAAMERLQELHIQLRRLRDTIPSLVRPVHADYASPEQLYTDFRGAAVGAVENVRRFRNLVRDEASKEVLAHARASRDAHGEQGIRGWLVEQHENWLDEPALRSAREIKTEEELVAPDEIGEGLFKPKSEEKETEVQDVAGVVKAFQERHPEVGVKLLIAISTIMVTLTPAALSFSVKWKANQTPHIYEVETKGTTKLHSSVNSGLARRTKKDDLEWTLEFIFDYVNIKQQRCHACNRILDDKSCFATVKAPKSSHEADDLDAAQWEWDSFHLGCA